MGFFRTARHEAAKEYGAARAEKYGRQERRLRWILAFLIFAFLIYCYILGQ
jgi:hypothetical protein